MPTCLWVDAANTAKIKAMMRNNANARALVVSKHAVIPLLRVIVLPKGKRIHQRKDFFEIKGHSSANRNHRKIKAGGWNEGINSLRNTNKFWWC